MIEAWIIAEYHEDNSISYRLTYEEPDSYYTHNPMYLVKHIAYSVLEKNK